MSSISTSTSTMPQLPDVNTQQKLNFTSIVHGDIGHLIADFLHLQALSQLARCSKNGRSLVEYKYTHFKHLDLDDCMLDIEPTNDELDQNSRFTLLCQKLRGIEVLQWSVNHLRLISPLDWDEEEGEFKPHVSAIAQLYANLILGNADRLRVLTVREIEKKDAQECWLTSSDICKYHYKPVMAIANYLPSLEVLDLGKISDGTVNTLIKRQEKLPQFGDAKSTSIDASPSMRGINSLLEMLPYEIPLKKPLLPHIEFHHLHHLRMISFVHLPLNQFRALVSLLPQIEMASVTVIAENEEDFKKAVIESQTNNSRSSSSSSCSPCSFTFRLPSDGGIVVLPLWSNLSSFSVRFDSSCKIPRHTIVEIRSPQLLNLNLTVINEVLADVVLELPQARIIEMKLTCIQSRNHNVDILERNESGDTIKESHFLRPPSLIQSLRHSTRLRSLIVAPIQLTRFNVKVNEDWRGSLTSEECAKVNQKMENEQEWLHNTMSDYHQRLFYYALSVLPCAATLELIYDSRQGIMISMMELCSLFPAMRSFSLTPYFPSSAVPDWFMPSNVIGRSSILKEKYMNAIAEKKEFNSTFVCEDYWQVASEGIHINQAMAELINQSGRFDHVTTLFLSTPTRVVESALTVIFIRCQQLHHVSLIQLVGVGNSLFMNLPHDCVRPSLRTLRLKNACIDKTLAVGVSPFDGSIVDTLIRLFPSIVDFDFISANDSCDLPRDGYRSLNRISHPMISMQQHGEKNRDAAMPWPHLRVLTLSRPTSAKVNAATASELALHLLLIDRTRQQAELEARGADFPFSKSELALHPHELNFVHVKSDPATGQAVDWMHSSRHSGGVFIFPHESRKHTPRLAYYSEPCCQAHLCTVDEHRKQAHDRDVNHVDDDDDEEEGIYGYGFDDSDDSFGDYSDPNSGYYSPDDS